VAVAVPTLEALLAAAERRALHLETRDVYAGSPRFAAWQRGEPQDRSDADGRWSELLTPLVRRGGDIRRARIVSEPVTEYIRFEWEVTPYANLAAGERVRWLPRRNAAALAIPGEDYWLIDDVVLFNHFSGIGELTDVELNADARVVRLCEAAFEEVWKLGRDHADYRPA
jgi:hypothetical protein